MEIWPTHFSARVTLCRDYGLVRRALLSVHLSTRKEMRLLDVRARIMDRGGLVAGLVVFIVGLLLWLRR